MEDQTEDSGTAQKNGNRRLISFSCNELNRNHAPIYSKSSSSCYCCCGYHHNDSRETSAASADIKPGTAGNLKKGSSTIQDIYTI